MNGGGPVVYLTGFFYEQFVYLCIFFIRYFTMEVFQIRKMHDLCESVLKIEGCVKARCCFYLCLTGGTPGAEINRKV